MKKRFFTIGLLILLACLFFPSAVFAEAYTTPQYDVKWTVGENRSCHVEETIHVHFLEPRHGIYRYIPIKGTTYREIDGKPTEITYAATVKNVKVEGYEYDVSTKNNNAVIQIGDPDSTVNGDQTYKITYDYDPGADGTNNYDTFYSNILPFQWPTAIDSASFTINMPKTFDPKNVNIYAGKYGAVDGSIVDYNVSGNTVTGHTTKSLEANQGITANILLPKGYWVGFTTGYEGVPFTIGASILAIILGVVLYFIFGRSKKPVEVVGFYPPHNFPPAYVGKIYDGDVSNDDIIATIIYLADKGYLTIEQTSKKAFTFHKQKALAGNEEPYVREVYNGLFEKKNDVTSKDLEDDFYIAVQEAQDSVTSYFEEEDHKIDSGKSTIGTLLMSVLALVTMFAFSMAGQFKQTHNIQLISSLIYTAVFGIGAFGSIKSIIKGIKQIKDKKAGKGIVQIIISIVITLILFGVANIMLELGYGVTFLAFLAIAVLGVLSEISTSRTDLGTTWFGEVLGFKNFIEKAEKDRINALVEENPNYFYDILPYAYVLNVTDKWAKNFEHLPMEPPVWYSTYDSYDVFNAMMFSRMMRTSMNHMSSSMINIPSDSGSGGFGDSGFGGGGGSGGGGSGGGGGGSW
ncbi:MAG: DUF2207 domain-containing protein [Eubacteriaceae bacterium]|nr:DUF2207 domain-containing protein [Eubacteriaceae bacterium]